MKSVLFVNATIVFSENLFLLVHKVMTLKGCKGVRVIVRLREVKPTSQTPKIMSKECLLRPILRHCRTDIHVHKMSVFLLFLYVVSCSIKYNLTQIKYI